MLMLMLALLVRTGLYKLMNSCMTVMMSDHEKYSTVELKNQTVSDIVVLLIMPVNLD